MNSKLRLNPGQEASHRRFMPGYFVVLLAVWTILHHILFGFEWSWAAPVAGVVTACMLQLILRWVDSRTRGNSAVAEDCLVGLTDLISSSMITGLACAMLIYPGDHLWPICFAASVAIGSKALLRSLTGNRRMQSVLNSTNLGVATALFLFPWAGLATPYNFADQLSGIWVWAVPGIVFLCGIAVHARFTRRAPLLLAWSAGFLLQACLRHGLAGNSWTTVLAPMTSTAFIVFSLYMISDPETTPIRALPQTVFGFAVAMLYGMLQVFHVAFGIFLALVIVGAVRGVALHMLVWREQARSDAVPLSAWAATSGDD
jgi:hypothetical protein